MQDYFNRPIQKLRTAHEPRLRYPPAWPLHDERHAKPEMNSQPLCPLFNKLSGELRIWIYQSILTDPHRFLHIIKNGSPQIGEGGTRRRAVAHYWCEDIASAFPAWQHSCYGESLDVKPGMSPVFVTRSITETSDRLLSLLLTCRRM